jgi:hypothetical protein
MLVGGVFICRWKISSEFDYTEADLLAGVIDDRWQALMEFQIQRARQFYAEAERGISRLSQDARWPVWSALALYRQILDVIEDNHYDVFNRRAYVPLPRKLLTLPTTLVKSRVREVNFLDIFNFFRRVAGLALSIASSTSRAIPGITGLGATGDECYESAPGKP